MGTAASGVNTSTGGTDNTSPNNDGGTSAANDSYNTGGNYDEGNYQNGKELVEEYEPGNRSFIYVFVGIFCCIIFFVLVCCLLFFLREFQTYIPVYMLVTLDDWDLA